MPRESFILLISLFIALPSFIVSIHVVVPAGNKDLVHKLYQHGMTIGEQRPENWDVYVEEDRLKLLHSFTDFRVYHEPRIAPWPPQKHYTTYYALVSLCAQLQHDYPDLATQFSIGKSVEGRKLLGIRIRSAPNNKKIKLIGNMHGDETLGRELLIRLAKYLLENYKRGNSDEIRQLVDSCEIHILPSMNPDGFHRRKRTNTNGYDLNRNFPDRFYGQITPLQPETLAVMQWSLRENFTMSANFHGGSLVVNYPFDGNSDRHSGKIAPTKDDVKFQKLAKAYSLNHPEMATSKEFAPFGITNGAQWYVLYGGMQDWNYIYTNDMEVTIELSYEKMPSGNTLDAYWEKNKNALLEFLKQINILF